MNTYRVTFPPLTANDTVQREVTTTIDGGAATTQTYPATQLTFDMEAAEGSTVTLVLVDIDDAMPTPNRSEPSDPFTFTATDTLAPGKPGQFSVEMISEG